MPKHSDLVEAAMAFDREIEAYRRAGELFVKTPLTSVKHLERANTTLGEIADCEERLQQSAQALVAALAAARGTQEGLAKLVVEHVPALQAKNAQLQSLMQEMAALGAEVAALNAKVTGKNGDGDKPHTPDPKAVSETVLSASAKAEALSKAARDAELDEVAVQAHALHQRLLSISKTLGKL